jgi:hypothetical protein
MQVVKSPLVSQKKYSEKEAAASTSRDWDFKIKESNIKQVDFNLITTILLRYQKDLITTI